MEIKVYSNGIREGYVGRGKMVRHTGTERRKSFRNRLANAVSKKLDCKRFVVTFHEALLSFDGKSIKLSSFLEVFPENGELFSEDEFGKYLHEWSRMEVIIHPAVKVFRRTL